MKEQKWFAHVVALHNFHVATLKVSRQGIDDRQKSPKSPIVLNFDEIVYEYVTGEFNTVSVS